MWLFGSYRWWQYQWLYPIFFCALIYVAVLLKTWCWNIYIFFFAGVNKASQKFALCDISMPVGQLHRQIGLHHIVGMANDFNLMKICTNNTIFSNVVNMKIIHHSFMILKYNTTWYTCYKHVAKCTEFGRDRTWGGTSMKIIRSKFHNP